MRNTVTKTVKIPYGSGDPIDLKVIGTWEYNGIVCAKVKHGEEFISPSLYPALYYPAISLAEIQHRKYLEEQQETKRAAIARLCGIR
jgi:hypothetical protein